MTYSVHFKVKLEAISEEARQDIRETMQQVAHAVDTIPPASPFWGSMKDSLLQIDVSGWRVVYRIEPKHSEIRVVEVSPVRRAR